MSTLSRDQVEVMLTSLVQDKVDGANVSRLLDHDLAQRDILRQREEERDRLHKATEHGTYVNVYDLKLLHAECRALADHVAEFPYSDNENGCLEYSRKIKMAAEQLRARLDELQ